MKPSITIKGIELTNDEIKLLENSLLNTLKNYIMYGVMLPDNNFEYSGIHGLCQKSVIDQYEKLIQKIKGSQL